MRWGAIALAFALAPGGAAYGQEANLGCAPVTAGSEVEEIRRLELRGAATNVEGWSIEEARAFFAPEWVSLQPDGSVMRVEAVFAAFQNGRSRPWARSFELPELDIRIYCGAAVVVGLGVARPLGAPDTAPPLRFRFLNVWRKQGGRWLYAANQFARH